VTKPALRVSQAAPRPYNWTPGRVKSARQADTLTPLRLTRAVIGVPYVIRGAWCQMSSGPCRTI
jgi:hypothetical protein